MKETETKIKILLILIEMYEYLEEVNEEEKGCNEGSLEINKIEKYYMNLIAELAKIWM